MFKRRFSIGAINKETAPEKGFFEHCDILRSLVDSSSFPRTWTGEGRGPLFMFDIDLGPDNISDKS